MCVGACVCVCIFVLVALTKANGLELYDVTHNSMRARWSKAEGVSGYMILYAALTDDGTSGEKEVNLFEAL